MRYHLARPLRIHGLGGQGADLEAAMTGLLERVSLTPAEQFLRKYPHELSGGQRQRVAIARALAVRPRVLLADEPVSMLDVSIRLGVLNLLGDLRERDKLGILYITHDIASARYLADVIMVMYAGQVVESGPATTLTDEPAHPYTQLLLSAAPDPDRPAPLSLQGRGSPPSLVDPPSGCRFHPRCPHAMAICAEATPPGSEVADRHVSACWLHVSGLTAAQRRLQAPQRNRPARPPGPTVWPAPQATIRARHPVPQPEGRSRDEPGYRLAAGTPQRAHCPGAQQTVHGTPCTHRRTRRNGQADNTTRPTRPAPPITDPDTVAHNRPAMSGRAQRSLSNEAQGPSNPGRSQRPEHGHRRLRQQFVRRAARARPPARPSSSRARRSPR